MLKWLTMHDMDNRHSFAHSFFTMLKPALALTCWLCCLSVSYALERVDIYSVSLPASSDEPSERKKIAQDALELVYRRASGDPSVMQNSPALKQFLGKAESYLQTFRYARRGGSAGDQPLVAYLSFAPASIKQHLRQTGTAFWQENRPVVTVLLLIKSSKTGRIALAGERGLISAKQVRLQANQVGLPVSLVRSSTLSSA